MKALLRLNICDPIGSKRNHQFAFWKERIHEDSYDTHISTTSLWIVSALNFSCFSCKCGKHFLVKQQIFFLYLITNKLRGRFCFPSAWQLCLCFAGNKSSWHFLHANICMCELNCLWTTSNNKIVLSQESN